jgi:hypothetical protein
MELELCYAGVAATVVVTGFVQCAAGLRGSVQVQWWHPSSGARGALSLSVSAPVAVGQAVRWARQPAIVNG